MVECGLLVIVVIAVGGIYWWLKRRLSFWAHRGLAYVKPRLLTGNLRKKRHIALTIAECYTKLRAKAQLGGFYFLQRACLLPLDTHLVARILTVDSSYFTHYPIECPDYGALKRDFATIESTWRNLWSRALDIARDFSTGIHQSEQKIDAFDISLAYNVQILATCFLGFNVNDAKLRNLRKLAQKHLKLSGLRHKKYLLRHTFPLISSLLSISELDDTEKSFHQLISMETKPGRGDKRYQWLLQITEPLNGESRREKIDLEKITRRAFGLFIAGIEASVATTAFCMYELAKSQDIQGKLRREIRHILTKHQVTYEALSHMKFMDAVIFETLRKYPPIGSTWRVTSKEYYVPNSTYIIAKGIPVVLPIYAIHHDSQHYAHPEQFNPDRFMKENSDEAPASITFMPFGQSDTICIEMHFALMQIKLMLVSLLKEFRILLHGEPHPDALAINPRSPTLTPKNHIWLDVQKLQDSAEI